LTAHEFIVLLRRVSVGNGGVMITTRTFATTLTLQALTRIDRDLSQAAVESFISRFEDFGVTKVEWRHQSYLNAGSCWVRKPGETRALDETRILFRHDNERMNA
jgi:hypothetical protein